MKTLIAIAIALAVLSGGYAAKQSIVSMKASVATQARNAA